MKRLGIIFCVSILILLVSCDNRIKVTRTDTPTSGIGEIVVDESLAPIIQEQVDVFEATYPDATIFPTYTSENEAFDLFMKDSIRVIISARELTNNEIQIIKDRKQTPRSQKLAVDGIALIVNKANADTLITVSDLRKILTGEIKSWTELYPQSKLGEIAVAFDSPNSSMARYMKDSICGDKPFGDNVKARSQDDQKTIDIKDKTPSQKVIDFVATTPGALGIIGVNWISNPTDTTNLSFINDIRVLSVSRAEKATLENSFKPFAAYLALDEYPLRRDIFIIISDVRGGLPSGFVNFAAGDIGQRIILKAGLLPATRPMRLVRANPTMK